MAVQSGLDHHGISVASPVDGRDDGGDEEVVFGEELEGVQLQFSESSGRVL